MKKNVLILMLLALIAPATGCSANLPLAPGGGLSPLTLSPSAKPLASSVPTQTPMGIPGLSGLPLSIPGLGPINITNPTINIATTVTVIQGDFNGRLQVMDAAGQLHDLPMPKDQAKAAALRAAAQPGKQFKVYNNDCGVTIDSDGEIFTYDTVDISENTGCIKVSALF